MDRDGNTALHCACQGAKYNTIAMFLEKYDAVSVSRRNAEKKLPIELLWESNAAVDRESVKYTESVFQLLRAYPETVMNHDTVTQSALDNCPNQNQNGKGKKRKHADE